MAQFNARKKRYGMLFELCHAIQPKPLGIYIFLRSFVYKTATKLNSKKQRSVIYFSLYVVLERYNTM